MNTTSTQHVIGIDLGNAKHAVCVTERASGEIIDERNITNHRESLRRLSQKYPGALMAMEVGAHSPWTSRFVQALGHEVLVANPRKMRAIFQNDRKCDLYDARMLAKIARFDPSLLYPIEHQSEEAQRDLLQIKLRDSLVRRRVDFISTVRGTLKSLGVALKSPNTNYFARHARRDLADEHTQVLALVEPVLRVLDGVTEQTAERRMHESFWDDCESAHARGSLGANISAGTRVQHLTLLATGDIESTRAPRTKKEPPPEECEWKPD